jgi:hypothetical protein
MTSCEHTPAPLSLGSRKQSQRDPVTADDPFCSLQGVNCNAVYGTSIMTGRMSLVPGQLNTISLTAIMNDVGVPNGTLILTLNGRSESMGGITMRTDANLKLNGIYFSTFYGGSSDSTWAPRPTDGPRTRIP